MHLEEEIKAVLNKHNQEHNSDTPDYVLAKYLMNCLDNFNQSIIERESFYWRKCPK